MPFANTFFVLKKMRITNVCYTYTNTMACTSFIDISSKQNNEKEVALNILFMVERQTLMLVTTFTTNIRRKKERCVFYDFFNVIIDRFSVAALCCVCSFLYLIKYGLDFSKVTTSMLGNACFIRI